MEANEIESLIARLRADGKALEGDGFGHVGMLKGACRKICRSLEEFVAALAAAEAMKASELLPDGMPLLNPDCSGSGSDNVPGCECRRIAQMVEQTLDKG